MAETKGVSGVVKIGPNGSTKTAMLHVTAFSLDETSETIDVTAFGDASRSVISSFRGFTGTVDGYWDQNDTNIGHDSDAIGAGGDSGTDLVGTSPLIKAGDRIDFELYPAGTGANSAYYAGDAIVTSIARSASFDGAVEYSISFDGTGDLSYSAA
tara:strand:+ start:11 stop:475 length:465 start_codon:yes stop_codon:yes gene_type:complete